MGTFPTYPMEIIISRKTWLEFWFARHVKNFRMDVSGRQSVSGGRKKIHYNNLPSPKGGKMTSW